MVRDGRGVSIPLALLVGLVATALSYLVLRVWTEEGGVLPATSWGALIVLLFMATGVLFAGLPVRRFLRGQARKPLNPLRAMRTLVLAQAAALTGALRLAALATGAVLMAVAGLVAQAMCRVDGDHGDRDVDQDDEAGPSYDH